MAGIFGSTDNESAPGGKPTSDSIFTDETGSALLSVLVIILIVTILIGSVLAANLIRKKLVIHDVHELQAYYAAEAGIQASLARLMENPGFRGAIPEIPLSDGSVASGVLSAHGAFIRVRGIGTMGPGSTEIEALVGEVPGGPFTSALWIGDPSSGINLGGTARIRGPVVTGNAGYQESRYQRRPFTGSFEGLLTASDSVRMPVYSSTVVDESIEWFHTLLEYSSRPDSIYSLTQNDEPILIDRWDLAGEGPLVVLGSAILNFELTLPPGATIVVRDSLTLIGSISGRDPVFFSGAGIKFESGFTGSGQFLTEGSVHMRPDTHLAWPSLILSTLNSSDDVVTLDSDVTLEGVLMALPTAAFSNGLNSPVSMKPGSHLIGALYSRTPVQLQGRVSGSVVTPSFRFYFSPTVYVNWLVDSTIDLHDRPDPFVVPPGFAEVPHFGLLSRSRIDFETK